MLHLIHLISELKHMNVVLICWPLEACLEKFVTLSRAQEKKGAQGNRLSRVVNEARRAGQVEIYP